MDSAKNKRLQDSRAIQNMSTKLPIEDLSRKGKKEEKQQDPKVSYKENQEFQWKWGKERQPRVCKTTKNVSYLL